MKKFNAKYAVLALLGVVCLVVFVFVFVDLRGIRVGNRLPTKATQVGYKLLTDKNNMFSIEIPANWTVSQYLTGDEMLAGMELQSPDLKITSPTVNPGIVLPVNFDTGAVVSVNVMKGILEDLDIQKENLFSEKDVTIDGNPAKYYVYKNTALQGAEVHEVRFNYGGRNYLMKIAFNPTTLANGEQLFAKIYSTFRFTRTQ